MKPIALFFTASLLASPVFAEDLCTVNMQKLDDMMATEMTMASELKVQVEELKMQAEKARSAGDLQSCGTHAAKALHMLEDPADDG
ncbi:MAG: hypothetical protein ACOH2I_08225 [Pseudomonas sp.]